MDRIRHTFRKAERLKAGKEVSRLFEEGRSVYIFPLKIIWIESEGRNACPIKAGFSVSRRIFRNAVDRNLLKRRMREAFRVNKHTFLPDSGEKSIDLMCLFIAREKVSFAVIEKATKAGLRKIFRQSIRDKGKSE
jgi:ribonuclease P protein component